MASEIINIIGKDFPTDGWENRGGNAPAPSKYGTWKNYWCEVSGEEWPIFTAVQGSLEKAEVGAHMYNPNVSGIWIVPLSNRQNGKNGTFTLRENTIVVTANQSLV